MYETYTTTKTKNLAAHATYRFAIDAGHRFQ